MPYRRAAFLASAVCYVLGICLPLIVIHPQYTIGDKAKDNAVRWSTVEMVCLLLREGYHLAPILVLLSSFVVPLLKSRKHHGAQRNGL